MSERALQIYVIQLVVGPIKVGITDNFKRRMAEIRSHQPFTATTLALEEGTYEREGIIHRELAQWNISGEWFADCAEVREILDRNFGRSLNYCDTIAPELYGHVRAERRGGPTPKLVLLRPGQTPASKRHNTVRKTMADGSVKTYVYENGIRVNGS